MDLTRWIAILASALLLAAILSVSRAFRRLIAPRSGQLLDTALPPRTVADAVILIQTRIEQSRIPGARSIDGRLAINATVEDLVAGLDPKVAAHPALAAGLTTLCREGSRTSMRIAVNAAADGRVAIAAQRPAFVRFLLGGSRVLSPALALVICMAIAASSAAERTFDDAMPFGIGLVLLCIACTLIRRVSDRATLAIAAHEALIAEIVISGLEAVRDDEPAIEVKSRVMHALHASIAATMLRRAA